MRGARNILEEDIIQELVLCPHHSIVLMPGQTLPLTIFHPTVISVMRKLIDTTKTFGSVHFRYLEQGAIYGTTAEIYEFRDPPESSLEVGLKLKVKGRQRFRIISQQSQMDG